MLGVSGWGLPPLTLPFLMFSISDVLISPDLGLLLFSFLFVSNMQLRFDLMVPIIYSRKIRVVLLSYFIE